VFLLESPTPRTIRELEAAGAELAESLERLSPRSADHVRTPE
jgi:hypothetical protein